MSDVVKNLPPFLKRYCVDQNFEKYTERDHTAWRFIMKRAWNLFADLAVSEYQEGFQATGMSTDRIPRIAEMDEALQKWGWGVAPVSGFIPPSIFLEFQSRNILPIATAMRPVDQIAYTPSPDIVHEAAGHAPILVNPGYREYLNRYATIATKAIYSREDYAQYEAIRLLSDTKQITGVDPKLVQQAEEKLAAANAAVDHTTELAKVSRMAWWTVEYGLAGSVDKPKIYGAGLLSSIGESANCLGSHVRKIPFSIDCVEQSYDITEPQPQLFVCRSMEHLIEVLGDFEKQLSFYRGGAESVAKALRAKEVTTTVLDGGIQISGTVDQFEHQGESCEWIYWSGLRQLASSDKTLSGFGAGEIDADLHAIIGRAKDRNDRVLATLSNEDLTKLGVQLNQESKLVWHSDISCQGTVRKIQRDENGKLAFLVWENAKLSRGNKQLAAGKIITCVGERVTSVFGGPADRAQYEDYRFPNGVEIPALPPNNVPKDIEALYRTEKEYRESSQPIDMTVLLGLINRLATNYKGEWLLAFDLLELIHEQYNELSQHQVEIDTLKQMVNDAVEADEDLGEILNRAPGTYEQSA